MDRDRSYHTAVTGVQIGGYSRAGRRATDTLRDRHRASVPGSVWRPGQARERVMCLNAASSGRRPDPGGGPARCVLTLRAGSMAARFLAGQAPSRSGYP